jgi:hypothetical protein
MQSRRTPAQQLLGQLSADLDPHSAHLIIVVGNLIDPVGHGAR